MKSVWWNIAIIAAIIIGLFNMLCTLDTKTEAVYEVKTFNLYPTGTRITMGFDSRTMPDSMSLSDIEYLRGNGLIVSNLSCSPNIEKRGKLDMYKYSYHDWLYTVAYNPSNIRGVCSFIVKRDYHNLVIEWR